MTVASDPAAGGGFSVTGKVVLITGASSGIGLDLARAFSRHGAIVGAASRSAADAATLQEDFPGRDGEVVPLNLDVTRPETIEPAVAELVGRFGRIDALINNAGTVVEEVLLKTSPADWDRIVATNLTGPLLMSQAVAAHMPDGRGSIINIASIAAVRAKSRTGAYGASKAGLTQMSKIMAVELSRRGVRVNVIVPGYVRTPMNDEFLSGPFGERLLKEIPLGRIGAGGDIAMPAIFLVSDASSYMTGSVLTVDGGILLR